MSTGILKGPPFDVSQLERTLPEYLNDEISRTKDRICLIDADTKRELRVSEVLRDSHNLAAYLQSLLCGRGTIVAIISENRLEYLTVFLAASFAGAICTCFNPVYTTGELKHVVGLTRPSIVFCSLQNYEKIVITDKVVQCVKHIIVFDDEIETPSNVMRFSNLIRLSGYKFVPTRSAPDDVNCILYSSGTTGLPKGVMITHKNFLYNLIMNKDKMIFGDGIVVSFVPMCHIYGVILNFRSILLDAPLIVLRKFEENKYLQLVQDYKVKTLFLVPPIVALFTKSASIRKYDLSRVEAIVSAGAPLQKSLEKEITEKLKLKYFIQGYGMTEALHCITKNKGHPHINKLGSCGSVEPGLEAKIIDVENDTVLPAYSPGEICVRGPLLMRGYYKNESATAATIDKEGWLHTGDIGYYDNDGDFFIIDRLKDLIKYNANQVSPAELEALLMTHPAVQDAAVIGIPADMVGEIPKAFVVRQIGSNITEKELVDFISELVSPHKRLRGGVTFVNEIPKAPSGKILKRELQKRYNLPSKY